MLLSEHTGGEGRAPDRLKGRGGGCGRNRERAAHSVDRRRRRLRPRHDRVVRMNPWRNPHSPARPLITPCSGGTGAVQSAWVGRACADSRLPCVKVVWDLRCQLPASPGACHGSWCLKGLCGLLRTGPASPCRPARPSAWATSGSTSSWVCCSLVVLRASGVFRGLNRRLQFHIFECRTGDSMRGAHWLDPAHSLSPLHGQRAGTPTEVLLAVSVQPSSSSCHPLSSEPCCPSGRVATCLPR